MPSPPQQITTKLLFSVILSCNFFGEFIVKKVSNSFFVFFSFFNVLMVCLNKMVQPCDLRCHHKSAIVGGVKYHVLLLVSFGKKQQQTKANHHLVVFICCIIKKEKKIKFFSLF
jgi:hypothetical protein